MSNSALVDEAIAEIQKRRKGRKEDAHIFIMLLEVTRDKNEIEQKLEKIRLNKAS